MYINCDHNNTFLAGCIHSMHVWIYDGVFVIAAGPLERVYLSAPIVAVRGKEANLTAVVWPSHTRTLTFFWWFDNSSEVRRFSSSTSSHHSSIHTRHLSFLLLLFSPSSHSSLNVFVLLFVIWKCKSTQISPQIMEKVTVCDCPVPFWRIQLGWLIIFAWDWLCSAQHPLIIQ